MTGRRRKEAVSNERDRQDLLPRLIFAFLLVVSSEETWWLILQLTCYFVFQEELVDEVCDREKEEAIPLSFDRHVHFVNFTKFDKQSPIYMNLVRDPVDRTISRSVSLSPVRLHSNNLPLQNENAIGEKKFTLVSKISFLARPQPPPRTGPSIHRNESHQITYNHNQTVNLNLKIYRMN